MNQLKTKFKLYDEANDKMYNWQGKTVINRANKMIDDLNYESEEKMEKVDTVDSALEVLADYFNIVDGEDYIM